jgi:hypothetical protein
VCDAYDGQALTACFFLSSSLPASVSSFPSDGICSLAFFFPFLRHFLFPMETDKYREKGYLEERCFIAFVYY